ncbi:MAG: nitrilase-related carbon-nitrogen hydrolase [Solirubrobacteraceae bacterium]
MTGVDGSGGSQSLRVLMGQLEPSLGDPEAGARRVADVIGAQPEAELAVFPELFLGGYGPACRPEGACALDSPAVGIIRQAAAVHRTAVIVGMASPNPDGSSANALLCVDRDGSLAGVHRKTYVFGEVERTAFAPGDCWSVVTLAGRKLGVMICFEMEFSEPARALARGGAELLVTSAANMHPYGDDHDLASRARALDNRRPHVYVNRVGHEDGLTFVGGSQAVDSAGQVIARAGPGERTLVCEVAIAGATDAETDYLSLLGPELPVRVIAGVS